MYAFFQTGGKQYRAIEGAIVRVEKIAYEQGKLIEWTGTSFSGGESPIMETALIRAEPIGVFKEPKVRIFKKKRRHNYRRTKGHRQQLLWAKITEIVPLAL